VGTTASGRHMQPEEFTVQGMTGVDLSLHIAGPGSRSYAFIIDWHIRLLAGLAWLFLGLLAVGGGLSIPDGTGLWPRVLVFAPAIIGYLLYHPIVELLMHGQTPGKRLAGVRVVNREGGTPGAGAILIRNAFRMIDSLPMFYAVGLVCCLVSAQRVRIGDMAAGTLLVVNEPQTGSGIDVLARRAGAAGIDPAALDLVERLLERWEQLDPARRRELATALLQKIDAQQPPPADLSDAGLRTRLRQLAGTDSH